MEKLKQEIEKELEKIEELIAKGENKNQIEKERKKLDKLLEEYIKDI